MHKSLIMVSAAALAFLLAGPTARAQQANYPLPQEPTAKAGTMILLRWATAWATRPCAFCLVSSRPSLWSRSP